MSGVAVSGHQFALFRALLGVYLLCHFVGLMPHAIEMFGDEGMFASQEMLPTLGAFPNLFSLSGSASMVYSVIGFGCVCATLLTLGVARRGVALCLWVVWLSLFNRNPFISNPSLHFIGLALLILAALPYGEPLAYRESADRWHVPEWVSTAGLYMLMLGYTVSGLHKLTASSWVEGTALTHVLNLPIARDALLREVMLALPEGLTKLATWSALGMEILALPLTLITFTRRWIWLGLFSMNLGILCVIDFADLTFGVLLFHLFVFDGRWLSGRTFESAHPVIFFDGVCTLCNHTVDFVMSEDRDQRFKFAPIQGEAGQEIQATEVRAGASIALSDGTTLYTKSDAILYIAAGLGGLWRVLSWTRFLPKKLRDAVYFLVQKNRYKVFGQRDTCRIPTPEERSRFLS